MLQVSKDNERGQSKIDWLNSRHTLTFGEYYDLQCMEFRNLRVSNEDRVIPRTGLEPNSHRDMEIVFYVRPGAHKHKDFLGTCSVIQHGEVQRASAGMGITHSEFNNSDSEELYILQTSIEPERAGLSPGQEQKAVAEQKLELPSDRGADLLLVGLA